MVALNGRHLLCLWVGRNRKKYLEALLYWNLFRIPNNFFVCILKIHPLFLQATPGWNFRQIRQMQSNTLRLNFCFLKIIHILHPCYHPKIKRMCISTHEIIRLIRMKMKVKMKNRSHRYNIYRPRSRHGQK